MASLAERLPQEVIRVMGLRDQYVSLRGQPNVIVEPQIAAMTEDLHKAIMSCFSNDVVGMLRCFDALKGWEG